MSCSSAADDAALCISARARAQLEAARDCYAEQGPGLEPLLIVAACPAEPLLTARLVLGI